MIEKIKALTLMIFVTALMICGFALLTYSETEARSHYYDQQWIQSCLEHQSAQDCLLVEQYFSKKRSIDD